MRFEATKEQIQKIAVNAVKASVPIGMGYLHFNAKQEFAPEEFSVEKELSLDYVGGRMVKLYIRNVGENTWETRDSANHDYQSWVKKYPTPKDLIMSVEGTKILEN